MTFETVKQIDEFSDKLYKAHPFKFNVLATQAKWTGWKYGSSILTKANGERVVLITDEGFCAQMVWYKRVGDRVTKGYYVNLPGMQSGEFLPGSCFQIGDQRVRPGTPPEEIDAMIEAGWKQLVELVQCEEGVDIKSLREV